LRKVLRGVTTRTDTRRCFFADLHSTDPKDGWSAIEELHEIRRFWEDPKDDSPNRIIRGSA